MIKTSFEVPWEKLAFDPDAQVKRGREMLDVTIRFHGVIVKQP